MKTIRELMAELKAHDIVVTSEGERLRINAPEGAVTPELKAELQARKPEILTFLELARGAQRRTAVVPISRGGAGPTLIGIPGHNGDVFCFVRLARELGAEASLHALEPPGLDGTRPPLTRIEDLASAHLAELLAFQPQGPYFILGYCYGGMVAFELGRQLVERGRSVALLGLLGTTCPTAFKPLARARAVAQRAAERTLRHTLALGALPMHERVEYLRTRLTSSSPPPATSEDPSHLHAERVGQATIAAAEAYSPLHYPGQLTIFLPGPADRHSPDLLLDWEKFAATSDVEIGPPECNGDTMLLDPHVQVTAARVKAALARALSTAGPSPERRPP